MAKYNYDHIPERLRSKTDPEGQAAFADKITGTTLETLHKKMEALGYTNEDVSVNVVVPNRRLCAFHADELAYDGDCPKGFEQCEYRQARVDRITARAPALAVAKELMNIEGVLDGAVAPQSKLAALDVLEKLDHGYLSVEGAEAITAPFGFPPPLTWERVDHHTPKGLRVAGKKHGEKAYGISAHALAEAICAHLGLIVNPMKIEGRGSRLRDAIERARHYLTDMAQPQWQDAISSVLPSYRMIAATRPVGIGKARAPLLADRWHYTIGDRWELIERDGFIKLASAMVPKKERQAVWFSTRRDWEPTATKPLVDKDQLDKNGMLTLTSRLDRPSLDVLRRAGHGLYRIGVTGEAAPYSWSDFIRMSGIHKIMAISLEQTGKEAGADPKDWWCSFTPVRREQWRSVEILYKDEWAPVKWS